MRKHSSTVLLLLAIVCAIGHEASAIWPIPPKWCPNVEGMANVDALRNAGIWYYFAVDENLFSSAISCYIGSTKIVHSNTALFERSFKLANTYINFTVTLDLDEDKPGESTASFEHKVKGFFNEEQVWKLPTTFKTIYTDYDSIQLSYSCTVVPHFWDPQLYKFYVIGVRNRSFDSFAVIKHLLPMIDQLGFSLNDAVFVDQSSSNCTNSISV